jgi:carboxyl-terminal processing protease
MSRVIRRLAVATVVLLLLAGHVAAQNAALDEVTRFVAAGRVWGLLKYFHPDVMQGTVDWDGVLIDAVPRISLSSTKRDFNEEIMRLVQAAGPMPRLAAGAANDRPETDAAFAWLDDAAVFDAATMQALKTIRNSQRSSSNRFVKPTSQFVLNPDFSGDTGASTATTFPNTPGRLLALFRFWNMVQYFFPYRDVADRPWSEVLPDLLPQFLEQRDATFYHLAVCQLTAAINDSHAVTSSVTLSQYWGLNFVPVQARYIESQTVVTRVFDRVLGGANIRVGDVVTSINGVATGDKRQQLRKYMTASNEAILQGKLNGYVLRGHTSRLTLGILRDGVERRVEVDGITASSWNSEVAALDALLPKWRMLPGNIGYVNMGRLQLADVAPMMEEFRSTRAIVFDQRNYPNSTLYAIAERLNSERRPFVTFTEPDYGRPGTFRWMGPYFAGPIAPVSNYYRGRVIVLADERTQSQAEFTIMALRTAPDFVLVGSTTSGADGNVSQILLPGGITTYFSGIGVFYPDRAPTQRVGIVPDVFVVPTVQGIRAGVDEVLQRALQLVP